MNSKLILTPIKDMTKEDWLRFRKRGIGASEVGCILGLSPYKSSIELFYEKIGQGIRQDIENMSMFMGKFHEPAIAELWEYWGGTEESMIENFYSGTKVRRCQKVNYYVQNPDYPWLFVSLDRKINKTETQGEGSLELKTISGYESDNWESGIPAPHIVQVQTQLLVCMFDHGELFTMKDGRRFDLIPFDFMPDVCDTIINVTKAFWDKVVAARGLATEIFEAERIFNFKKAESLKAQLVELEPSPDGSDAYNNYLKKKFNIANEGEMTGSEIDWEHAIKYNSLKDQIEKIKEEQQLHKNCLMKTLGNKDTMIFKGDEKNKVTWKANKNNVRTFLVKIKE